MGQNSGLLKIITSKNGAKICSKSEIILGARSFLLKFSEDIDLARHFPKNGIAFSFLFAADP